MEKAPNINDTILINRFKKFKETPVNFKNNDGNDDDNRLPPGLGPAPPQPTFNDFQDFQVPPPPAFPEFQEPYQNYFFNQQQPKNTFDRIGNAPVDPGEQVMSEIERVVEKAKHEEEVEKIMPADPLLEYFNRADEIRRPDFIWQKM